MKADWRLVRARDPQMDRQAFFRKYRLDSHTMKQARDENPGAFEKLGAITREILLPPHKLTAMKTDFLKLAANLISDNQFKKTHQLSSSIWNRYRIDPLTSPDFPLLKGPLCPKEVETPLTVKQAQDWLQVREGKLAIPTFQKRYPDVRADQIVVFQNQARRSAKSIYAELSQQLKKDPVPTAEIQQKLRHVKARWPEVQARKISQRALLKEIGLTEGTFRHHKTAVEFPDPPPRPEPFKAPVGPAYSPQQVDAAKALFARLQLGQLGYAGLVEELKHIGFSRGKGIQFLRKHDAVAFANRAEFLARHHDQIISDIVQIVKDHRYVIKKWTDFTEVIQQQKAFENKYGVINLDPMGTLIRTEMHRRGTFFQTMTELGLPVGQGQGPEKGRPQPSRISGLHKKVPPANAKQQPLNNSRQQSARTLAEKLRHRQPDPQTLERIAGELKRNDPNFASRRQWMNLRAHYEGVFPELKRWNFDSHRPYSLRFVARWTEAAHQAGPGASYEEIAAIFTQSPEYREDGRLPPKASGTVIMAKQHPELISSWAVRRTYQTTCILVELLRTAPEGKSLYGYKAELKKLGKTFASSLLQLQKLTPIEAQRFGIDPKVFAQLKHSGFKGLGQPANPHFDRHAEPPGVDRQLVREILETPTMPPMLDHAIAQLNGDLVFKSHNVMFINHRYSDITSLVNAFADAGMTRSTAVFVSTPYPFKDSVSYQLRKSGITVYDTSLSMKSYAENVERGIRQMLETYQQQVESQGKGKPIMIIDDGGMASKMIKEKFKDHIGKFRIVEITPAGHRLAKEFKKELKRLPFVYFSLAYTELKRTVTSKFFANRVVQRIFNLLPQSKIRLQNQNAAVLGGGPMALFAATALQEKGYQVTMVEPEETVANGLRAKGFKVLPLEQALPGRSLILGMSGYETLKAKHLNLIDDNAVVVQGSSKRQEFEMDQIAKQAVAKKLLPREDGLNQKSYTYSFKLGNKTKNLHFLGDGWTINHDGSLHGTPMEDIQLELALVFETAVQAAKVNLRDTGVYRQLSSQTQMEYLHTWENLKKSGQPRK